MSARKKYWLSLLTMVVLVGGIWGGISLASSCTTTPVQAATSTPTPTTAPSASPTAAVTATAAFVAAPSPSPSATQAPSSISPVRSATPTVTPAASPAPATTSKRTCTRGLKPRLGLDLQGGLSVVLTPTSVVKSDALDKAVEIIRQRVDALGVAEPDISRQGNNILVQ